MHGCAETGRGGGAEPLVPRGHSSRLPQMDRPRSPRLSHKKRFESIVVKVNLCTGPSTYPLELGMKKDKWTDLSTMIKDT